MQYMISLKIFIFVFYNMFSYFNSSRVESADLRIKKLSDISLHYSTIAKRDCAAIQCSPLSVIVRYSETVLTTVCPRSSDPFYMVNYYIKGVTPSWTVTFNFTAFPTPANF